MTLHEAGTSADRRPALSDEEADRLADHFRPAWELDEEPVPAAAEARLAPIAGAAPSADTVIDGAPAFNVGPTDPGTTNDAPAVVLAAPSGFGPALPTRMGLGLEDQPAAMLEAVSPSAAPPAPAAALPATPSFPVPTGPGFSGSMAGQATPRASVLPDEEPITPPTRSQAPLFAVLGLAAAAVIGVAAYFLTRPGPTASREATPTVSAEREAPVAAATATAAKPTAAPAATAPGPTATAVASQDSSVANPEPTTKATADTSPPKSTAAAQSTAKTKKPPVNPKTGGGIIRDVPF